MLLLLLLLLLIGAVATVASVVVVVVATAAARTRAAMMVTLERVCNIEVQQIACRFSFGHVRMDRLQLITVIAIIGAA